MSPSKTNTFRRASSTIEYMALIVFVLAVFLAFQHYIVRGMAGKWRASGDAIGLGRQYDPRLFGNSGNGGTLECYYETRFGIEDWVDRRRAEELCDCTSPDPPAQIACDNCLRASINPMCDALFK